MLDSANDKPLIFLVSYRDARLSGGSLRVLETLAKSLPGEGFSVEVVFAYGDADGVSRAVNCPVHCIQAGGANDLLAWLRFRRLVIAKRPILIQFVDAVGWMIIATVGLAIPRLTYAHGRLLLHRKPLLRWSMTSVLNRLTHGLIVISYGVKRNLVGLGVVRSDCCWIVHNAIDPVFLSTEYNCTNLSYKSDSGTVVLGMACRLIEGKGVMDAVRLLQYLPTAWHIVIAGEGPDKDDLECLIKKSGFENRIRLLGNVEDMNAFYKRISYYLFLTRYEPFGLVLAESMYCGVPVVGLRADGEYAESEYPLIDESVALMPMRADPFDYFHAPRSFELQELANQLLALHDDARRREGMIDRARQRVKERFMSTQQASKLAAVYRSILSHDISVTQDDNDGISRS